MGQTGQATSTTVYGRVTDDGQQEKNGPRPHASRNSAQLWKGTSATWTRVAVRVGGRFHMFASSVNRLC